MIVSNFCGLFRMSELYEFAVRNVFFEIQIHLTKKDSLPIMAVFSCTLAYTTEARNSKNQVSLFANDDFFSTMKHSPWILVPSAKSFKSFETVIFVVCI